jgi:hypothetical protein
VTAHRILWVVDYDIPEYPKAKRRAFYRARTQLFKDHKICVHRSTDSVLICDHKTLAMALYNLAVRYGEAHLYRVLEVAGGKTFY